MTGQSILTRLDSIPFDPQMTPEAFCKIQPCVEMNVGGANFTLIQPTSTLIVYALGLLWLAAACYFWRTRDSHRSRLWMSVSLLLGGVAAILAGTSYQAFGYEIKCAGRDFCVWTSWWEVAYLILQAACMDAMLAAVAHAGVGGKWRRILIGYAALNALAYFIIAAVGALVPVKFMVSFELLSAFSAPNLLLVFAISGVRYGRFREKMDLAFLGAVFWLAVTMVAYFAYMTMGVAQRLWEKGLWFSENDVLHIFMAIWIAYVALVLGRPIRDAGNKGRRKAAVN